MASRRRKSIVPRNRVDSCAFIFLITVCILTIIYDFFILLPRLGQGVLAYIIYVPFLIYVSLNATGNFLKLILIDTSILTLAIDKNTSQFGWKFCPVCESAVPPRSYHCNVCNICILRQDHHCIFSGCCIGFHNHRYYMGLITHLWLGSLFTVFFNYFSGHLSNTVGGFTLMTFTRHILPFPFLLMGSISFETFIILMLSVINLFGLLFVTGLLMHHWMLLATGQTTWERGSHITRYQCKSKRENIASVLGHAWFRTLLWFNAKSIVHGDGARFEKCSSGAASHARIKKH